MKFLVVGLGSMGKRRIRCLLALNQKKKLQALMLEKTEEMKQVKSMALKYSMILKRL